MGCDKEYGDDWIEITPEEFNRIFEPEDEIELDIDEFVSFWDEAEYEQTLAEEEEPERRMYLETMRQSMSEGNYRQAFVNALGLRRGWYSSFKDEIDECIHVCAEHEVRGALIIEAGKHTCRGTGKVDPGGFKYLRCLSDIGYIKSFRWLADCYFYGIGCERDMEKAGRLYFEGVLFDKCDYCRKKYAEVHPELVEYQGDELVKRLINTLVVHSGYWSNAARVKIAELILDGTISDYEAESAFFLLKESLGWDDDGIDYLRLGECLLFGVGTEADPIIASYLLDEAEYSLKRTIHNQISQESIAEAFHENIDYEEEYNRAKELAETAKKRKEEIMDSYEFACEHEGYSDPDLIYDEWENKILKYIKRAKTL